MNPERSLEEDILYVFWESKRPLKVSEVKEALQQKKNAIPFSILEQNIQLLERADILKSQIGFGWGMRYWPTLTRQEFELHPSEWLLTRCLCASGLSFRLKLKLNIVRQIVCLQSWYHRRED